MLNQATFPLCLIVEVSAMHSCCAWKEQQIKDIWLDNDVQLDLV